MIFVADQIPVELLNEQMDPAEVLAVEVKQFASDEVRTLVPKVIGQTAGALQKKQAGSRSASKWTEERFLREIGERQGQEAAKVSKEILGWAQDEGLRIWWGSGTVSGSFIPMLDRKEEWHSFDALWTYGSVEMQFQYMKGPYEDEKARLDLLQQLNSIPGVELDPSRVSARPSFPISVLTNPEHMASFP